MFKSLKNLKDVQRWERVFFNDDYTPIQQSEVNDLRALCSYAKSLGYDAAVKGTAILINGRKHAYRDLHTLPQELSLSKAKCITVDQGKGLAFQSKHCYLSNMSSCTVDFDGHSFNSSECAFQYAKAKACGTQKVVIDLLVQSDPAEAKRAARHLKTTRDWNTEKEKVMKDIITAKFSNPPLKAKPLSTGDLNLYEATQDGFWACGHNLNKADLIKPGSLTGSNKMGKILETVRKELRE